MINYKFGGNLAANHPTYVVREQDAQLYEKLLAGEYCYVFNARQMGKSSLRVSMMKKLGSQGCICAVIDMGRLGNSSAPKKSRYSQFIKKIFGEFNDFSAPEKYWYNGFIKELFSEFNLNYSINSQEWIESYQSLPNTQILVQFIEKILFINFPAPQKIYIFLDEIDVLTRLPFKNQFLAFIRSCYNRRAEDKNSDYHRLVFGFFGVATPEDLIKDGKHTPFNIGHGIELTQLIFAKGKKNLTEGLKELVDEPEAVLKKVFEWSNGQPFLTQKICKIIVDADTNQPDVDNLVKEHILTYWKDKDRPPHLTYISHYLLEQTQLTAQLLKEYKRILLKGEVTANDSPIQMRLRLSGIVIKKRDKLVVFNKIYQTIFNQDWVEEQLANLRNDRGKPTTQSLIMSLVVASLVSAIIISFRSFGWLQQLELNEYDRLMQWRPQEKLDPNILIVEATQADIGKFGFGKTLEDGKLAEVIDKIDALQPAIIGLDLWRDKALKSEANYRRLLTLLANNQKIIAVCSTSEYHSNKPGTKPPEGVPENRLGFTDLVLDVGQVHIVRRHLMSMGSEERDPCQTKYSLSAKVALKFLAIKGIKQKNVSSDSIRIGDATFNGLSKGKGIYQKVDDGGFQFLLNYRNSDKVSNKVAQTISISDVLDGEINDSLVKDKIVLIGTTDPTSGDKFYTPYSKIQPLNQKQMSGVIIHAHKVSQIISAVLDGRPLITFWSWWVEWLWILGWSGIGGIVSWRSGRVVFFVLLIGVNIFALYSISLFVLIQGFVLPLVPSVLTLIITGVGVFVYNFEVRPRGTDAQTT
jgi:CHASE2 domain-containing sensor protein